MTVYPPLVPTGTPGLSGHFPAAQLGGIFRLYPPSLLDFQWVHQSACQAVQTESGIYVMAPGSGYSNLNQIHCLVQAAPPPPYRLTAGLFFSGTTKAALHYGLVFRQASNGSIHEFLSENFVLGSYKWTSAVQFSASYRQSAIESGSGFAWMQISDDGTNRNCYIMADGQTTDNRLLFHSVGRTDFITADQIGFSIRDENTVQPNVGCSMTVMSWQVETR